MKQSKLLQKVYAASLSRNVEKLEQLRKEEFKKIANRKTKGKPFTPKWTLVDF